MQYKGYVARVEFDQEAGVLFGEIEGLRDVVTFEATDIRDLESAFQESVDDYLAMCAERGEEPEKAYSGKFLLRVDPSVHRRLAFAAVRSGTSLNALVAELLGTWVEAGNPQPGAGPASSPVPAPNAREREVSVYEAQSLPASTQPLNEGPQLRLLTPDDGAASSTTPNTPAGTQTPPAMHLKRA